ncbi:hypothetical protein MMC26_005474 [Xylographa opegraphella]|nr:hypothetical protein [Xylographa opegraphella]
MLPVEVEMERTAATAASGSTSDYQSADLSTERSPPPEIISVRKIKHDAPKEPAAKRQRTEENHNVVSETASLSIPSPAIQTSEEPKKRWTALGWHAKQYFALANAAWDNFPLLEFQQTHQKTRQEIWDVFMGVIRIPLLQFSGRGSGVPRGGLGEARMKEMRSLEKEGKINIREEDERQRKADAEDERMDKHAGPDGLLCKNCKIKCTRRPATIAEAQEDVRAAIEEFNRRSGVLERMKEKAARENAE